MSGSLKEKFQSCRSYISCVNDQRTSFKVAESVHQVWITKEEVLKMHSLYIRCGLPKKKLRSLYIMCGLLKKKF